MNNWQIFKLNEICTTRSGVLNSRHSFPLDGDIPFIKAKDILFNTIIFTEEQVSEDILTRAGVEIVPKESILIAASGSNAGNIALLGKDAVVNQHVLYATVQTPLIKPRFLYYYLFFKRHLLVKASKYALRVSYRFLQKLDIPLPSLKEQRQIIQYLDIHLKRLNTSISTVKKSIGEIDHEKQQLLNKVFSFGQAGKSFNGWNILKLKDCGVLQAGRTPNGAIKGYYGSEYPLFKPTDLRQHMQLKSADSYLSAKGLKEARYVRANSLLICTSGVNLGKVGITQVDGACSQQMISLTPEKTLLPSFIYLQMLSENFKQQLLKQAKNSIVNKSSFKNLLLAVTTYDNQQKIVNKLGHEINLLVKKEDELNKRLHDLEKAKSDLLLQAFSNKTSKLVNDTIYADTNGQ